MQAKIKDTDYVVQGGTRNIIRKSTANPLSKQVESLAIVPSLAGFLLSLVPLSRHLPINNLILMRYKCERSRENTEEQERSLGDLLNTDSALAAVQLYVR